MIWPVLGATLVAGTLASLSDWFFMGVLFHEHYNTYPEIWRDGVRDGKEKAPVLWSTALGYLTALCLVLLCVLTGVRGIGPCLAVVTLAYLAGPFGMQVINAMFIKFDERIAISHCLGWFARFLIAGVAAGVAL